MPNWSENDLTLAKAVQAELGVPQEGLNTVLQELTDTPDPAKNTGGGSDDIGDISWQVPTIV
jgi:aminobenzoyl-glutamate utilization protein B